MTEFHRRHVERAQETSTLRFELIQALRAEYYATTLASVAQNQVDAYVHRTTLEGWRNPNLTVGQALVRAGQVFADAKVAYVEDSEGLLAVAHSANNVSSPYTGIRGTLERAAKLHIPQLIGKRYRSFRELVGFTQEDIQDAMALSLINHENQPVTVYPFETETTVCDTLLEVGFRQDEEFHDHMFDTRATGVGVYVLKFIAPNAGDVVDQINRRGS